MPRTARSKFFITLALTFSFSVLLLISFLRSSNAKATALTNNARATVSSPSENKRQTAASSCPTCAPETQQTIYAPIFDVPEAASSEINLNCRSSHPMDVTPTFYTMEGTPIVGEVIHLQPAEIRFINTKSLIPAEYRQQQRRWGGMSLSYTGHYMEAWAQLTLHGIGRGGSVNVLFSVLDNARSNKQAVVWWMPPGGTATLALGNSSAQSVHATLEFSDRDSQDVEIAPFATEIIRRRGNQRGGHLAPKGVADSVIINSTGAPGSLAATGFVGSANGKFTGSLRFYDIQKAAQPNLFATRFKIKNVAPHLLLRNTTAAVINAQPRFRPMAGESGNPVELPSVRLEPNEATEVNLDPLMAAVANRSDLDEVSVQVLSSGEAGSLIGALYGTDQTTGTVYDVPLRDSGALRISTGGYPVRLDGDYTTIISITNVSDNESEFTAYINHEGGRYTFPVRRLAAGETAVFDARKMRDGQTPDAKGQTLPTSFKTGQFRWSIHGGGVNARFLGRAEVVSRAAHVSSSYSCTGCCPSNFSGAYLTTDSVLLLVDGFTSVGAVEVDADCYGNDFSFPVPASWSSAEASIASVVADEAGAGQVTGIAPGQTIVRAIWPTESYSFDGQDCYDNGIMNVSAVADMMVAPMATVENTPITAVGKGYTSAGLNVVLNPSPSQIPVTLTLSTTNGTGEARFAENNSTTMSIAQTTSITIKGITESSTVNNIRLEVSVDYRGTHYVYNTYDFTVVLVTLSLRRTGNVSPDNRGITTYNDTVGTTNLGTFIAPSGFYRGQAVTGVEIVGAVMPSNFAGMIMLRRQVDEQCVYNDMALEFCRSIPESSETSSSTLRDDDPQSGGSMGKVYDLDAPGLGDESFPPGRIRRVRSNFREWATLQGNPNVRLSDDLLWFSRISIIKPISGSIRFLEDVPGDNVAGTGRTPMPWNLQ